MLSLGTYPGTSLKLARTKRDEARALLAQQIDPGTRRKDEKSAHTYTLVAIADEWVKAGCPGGKNRQLKSVTVDQLRHRFDKYLKPKLGKMPVASVAVGDLRSVLLNIQDAGNRETAHRVRALAERLFQFAIATGRAERNIAADLRGTLAAVATTHFAAITNPDAIGQLLRAIDGYNGQPSVMHALRLAPHVFVRPGELRAAQWSEFNTRTATWVIPEHRMKMGRPHTVPLSHQVMTYTIVSPSSTPLERIVAVVEVVSPVSVSDVKDAKNVITRLRKRFGGRRGNADTRATNQAYGDRIDANGGSADGGGFNRGAETHFPGDGPGNSGGRFSDGSATDANRDPFEFQSATTNADGVPTPAEMDAATDIAVRSQSPVILVEKIKPR